jgi:hypothetical protein
LGDDDTSASVRPQNQLYEIHLNVTFGLYGHGQQFYPGRNQYRDQHDGEDALHQQQV